MKVELDIPIPSFIKKTDTKCKCGDYMYEVNKTLYCGTCQIEKANRHAEDLLKTSCIMNAGALDRYNEEQAGKKRKKI